MRRKDREITENTAIECIIKEAQICRLAMCDGTTPYIVPMNFGYRDKCLYFHCAREGRKLDILKANNNVCFEMDIGSELITGQKACDYSMRYKSVIGYGKAYLIDDYDQKIKALDSIMEKYSVDTPFKYSEKSVHNIVVLKVEIENMTGKQTG